MHHEPDDPHRVVNYWSDSSRQAYPRLQDVSRAREVAQLRVLELLWSPKVEEYAHAARQMLREHRPVDADIELHKADKLPYRDRVDLRLSFPENLMKLLADTDRQVAPELRKYQEADELVIKANVALRVRDDPAAAELLRRSAAEAYPYHPGIEKLRAEIIAEARRVLRFELVAFRRCLEHRSSWQSAMESQASVDALLEIDRGIGDDGTVEADLLRELTRRTAELDCVNRADGARRLAGLQAMREDYAQFWSLPGWRGLRVELERLEEEHNLVEDHTADLIEHEVVKP